MLKHLINTCASCQCLIMKEVLWLTIPLPHANQQQASLSVHLFRLISFIRTQSCPYGRKTTSEKLPTSHFSCLIITSFECILCFFFSISSQWVTYLSAGKYFLQYKGSFPFNVKAVGNLKALLHQYRLLREEQHYTEKRRAFKVQWVLYCLLKANNK